MRTEESKKRSHMKRHIKSKLEELRGTSFIKINHDGTFIETAKVKNVGSKYVYFEKFSRVDKTGSCRFYSIQIGDKMAEIETFFDQFILGDVGSATFWDELPEIVKHCRHETTTRYLGNCYKEIICYKCNYRYTVDSSG